MRRQRRARRPPRRRATTTAATTTHAADDHGVDHDDRGHDDDHGRRRPATRSPACRSTDAAAPHRPALVVKIDNHPDARPQAGLNQADIVLEENVEGITRFAAVFQTTDADPVGPIRSARTTDIDSARPLDQPLFAWSGGNANVRPGRSRGRSTPSSIGRRPGTRVLPRRPRPRVATEHTLFNEGTPTLYAGSTPATGRLRPPFFSYRRPATPFGRGQPVDECRR